MAAVKLDSLDARQDPGWRMGCTRYFPKTARRGVTLACGAAGRVETPHRVTLNRAFNLARRKFAAKTCLEHFGVGASANTTTLSLTWPSLCTLLVQCRV